MAHDVGSVVGTHRHLETVLPFRIRKDRGTLDSSQRTIKANTFVLFVTNTNILELVSVFFVKKPTEI